MTAPKNFWEKAMNQQKKVYPFINIYFFQSCWNMTATKRPTASEIVELLSNSPRLISPCIDVPLASVQVERTDSLELIPSVRKPSGSVSQVNKPGVVSGRSGRTVSDKSKKSSSIPQYLR